MSNEYKNWLWDRAVEIAIERGLVDTITAVEPTSAVEGMPHHIWGEKNSEKVKYYIHYSPDEGWLCEHRELDI